MTAVKLDLSTLINGSVRVLRDDAYPEQGQASVIILFSDGTRLRATYWRLIVNRRASLTSFDHEQKYGLPAPIDAKEALRQTLDGRKCTDARMHPETGDLWFLFDPAIQFEVFNFTGYEIWEITFPDGRKQYSNYALEP
jgi:hypothetical protein